MDTEHLVLVGCSLLNVVDHACTMRAFIARPKEVAIRELDTMVVIVAPSLEVDIAMTDPPELLSR